MSQNYPYGVGISNVGSYQVSGIPYATSSIAAAASSGTPTEINFPDVTQRIFVSNIQTQPLRVGFSSNGVKGTNYFLIPAASSSTAGFAVQEFRVKVKSIYLLSNTATPASASIFAELSNIDTNLLNQSGPTGLSNWSGSVGVG